MASGSVNFGPFVFDRERMSLVRDGAPIPLGGRAAALLSVLIDAEGETVGKSDLIEAAWPGVLVEEGNLAVQIAALRKALGGDAESIIVTVPRLGYRLVLKSEQPAQSHSVGEGMPSVAVLPFANLSGDVAEDYFADGIVEDITTALSRFGTFSVVSRSSAFVYKGRAFDVREAARELGVRYALEGGVRRQDRHVRVTAKLLDAESGQHLWGDKFDGDLGDIFAFQDSITESVIGLIEPELRRAEIERSRRKRPDSLDAYDLYLQALPYMNGVDPEGYRQALVLLRRAVALDPGFALGHVYLAWSIEKRLNWGVSNSEQDNVEECLAHARKALELDPDEPLVMAVAGFILHVIGKQYEAGLGMSRKAVAANPNSPIALILCGTAELLVGDTDRALQYFLRSIKLSPNAPDIFSAISGVATLEFMRGNDELAVEWCERSLSTFKEWPMTYWTLVPALALLGRVDEAEAALAKLMAIAPGTVLGQIAAGAHPERFERARQGFVIAGLS
jgi:TolB-like protein/Flp pilus assembly protein TadD